MRYATGMTKPTTPPRESAVEARLVRRVRIAGGEAFKMAPTVAGLPDRLVVLPGGRVHFVEVKADGGRLSRIQEVRIAELRSLGAEVHVVTGTAGVDDYLAQHVSD